jgi:Tannase and feruloyl esterase
MPRKPLDRNVSRRDNTAPLHTRAIHLSTRRLGESMRRFNTLLVITVLGLAGHALSSSWQTVAAQSRPPAAVLPERPAFMPPVPAPAVTCASLASLKLPDTTITSAAEVAPGAFQPEGPGAGRAGRGGRGRGGQAYDSLPAFCRVAGIIKPVPDSNIKFEAWMPVTGWNGRFQGVGNSGLAGSLSYGGMASAVAAGYATGSTDTGHESPTTSTQNAQWAMGHPEQVIDFGYRAVHEMTVKAKAVTAAFYGGAPDYSYWNGCSEGGRQAMGEAQRYPDDYDGIVAGSPVVGFTHTQTRSIQNAQLLAENPSGFIPASKFPMIHDAVLAQCDAADGVKDGIVGYPPACTFDPASLLCTAGDAPTCLTAPQVKQLNALYDGTRNPRTGERISFGSARGVELLAAGRTQDEPPDQPAPPSAFYRYFVFENPNWDWKSFDFDKDVAFADQKLGGIMNNFDPDLSALKAKGGKLIHYHGWADPQPSPENSVEYFEEVQRTVGDTSSFYRLFMIPGMGHCSGGPGTDQFDKMSVIRAWVEDGKAPDLIVAEHRTNGQADRSRPLCPHPQVAKYKGSGSTDDAANFVCGLPGS